MFDILASMSVLNQKITDFRDRDSLSRFLLQSALIVCTTGEEQIPCSQYNSSLLELFTVILEKDNDFSWSRRRMNYASIKADFDRNEYPEKCGNITYILLSILEKVLSDTVTQEFSQAILTRLINEYDFHKSVKDSILRSMALIY